MKTKITRMGFSLLLIIGVLAYSLPGNAQDYKKLIVTLKSSIGKEHSIYVQPIDNDRVLATDHLKNSLSANGFKVITEKKNADFVITIDYKHRNDSGCGGQVIKNMTGNIISNKKNGENAGNFNFSQSGFEGKCTSDLMSVLAKRIIEESFKNK